MFYQENVGHNRQFSKFCCISESRAPNKGSMSLSLKREFLDEEGVTAPVTPPDLKESMLSERNMLKHTVFFFRGKQDP